VKTKLTKAELKEHRDKDIAISRAFFGLAIFLMLLFNEGILTKQYVFILGFGFFFIFFVLLTGAEYRKYYFLVVPPYCTLCLLIGGLKGFVLCIGVFFILFFVSMWLGKRSFEKKKGIAHSW
jgi:hypothetical protein